jgi:hypothetical protein
MSSGQTSIKKTMEKLLGPINASDVALEQALNRPPTMDDLP